MTEEEWIKGQTPKSSSLLSEEDWLAGQSVPMQQNQKEPLIPERSWASRAKHLYDYATQESQKGVIGSTLGLPGGIESLVRAGGNWAYNKAGGTGDFYSPKTILPTADDIYGRNQLQPETFAERAAGKIASFGSGAIAPGAWFAKNPAAGKILSQSVAGGAAGSTLAGEIAPDSVIADLVLSTAGGGYAAARPRINKNLDKIAIHKYARAAKFPNKLTPQQRNEMAEIGLKNNIEITEDGYSNLIDKIKNIEAEKMALGKPIRQVPIDANRAAERARSRLYAEASKREPLPSKAKEAIDEVIDNFINDPENRVVTWEKALNKKQAIWEDLENEFAKAEANKTSFNRIQAATNKAIGSELKNETERIAMEYAKANNDVAGLQKLAQLNKAEGELLRIEPAIRARVNNQFYSPYLEVGDLYLGGVGAIGLSVPAGFALAGARHLSRRAKYESKWAINQYNRAQAAKETLKGAIPKDSFEPEILQDRQKQLQIPYGYARKTDAEIKAAQKKLEATKEYVSPIDSRTGVLQDKDIVMKDVVSTPTMKKITSSDPVNIREGTTATGPRGERLIYKEGLWYPVD